MWFSAIQFAGTPLAALEFASRTEQLVCSGSIRDEVERKLASKFGWRREVVRRIMDGHLAGSPDIDVPGRLRGVCRDAKDEHILECALIANASVIVSGDNDLLEMHPFRGIDILNAYDYLKKYATG